MFCSERFYNTDKKSYCPACTSKERKKYAKAEDLIDLGAHPSELVDLPPKSDSFCFLFFVLKTYTAIQASRTHRGANFLIR